MREFIDEKISFCCLGSVGPLNVDDDNFITRWMVNRGWRIKIQYSEDACITTNLGEYPKFLAQCMRWARTTWRSNPRSLRSLQTWKSQPWCIYSVYLTSMINFALLWDPALIILLCLVPDLPISKKSGIPSLCALIFCSKFLKTWPHFRRHPRDLAYIIPIILFSYYHSAIKFRALLTVRDTNWGSRPLDGNNVRGVASNNDEEQGLLGVDSGANGGYGTLSDEDNVGDATRNKDTNARDTVLENDVKEGLLEVVIESDKGDISRQLTSKKGKNPLEYGKYAC